MYKFQMFTSSEGVGLVSDLGELLGDVEIFESPPPLL